MKNLLRVKRALSINGDKKKQFHRKGRNGRTVTAPQLPCKKSWNLNLTQESPIIEHSTCSKLHATEIL